MIPRPSQARDQLKKELGEQYRDIPDRSEDARAGAVRRIDVLSSAYTSHMALQDSTPAPRPARRRRIGEMRLVVTGAGGGLGRAVLAQLPAHHEVSRASDTPSWTSATTTP